MHSASLVSLIAALPAAMACLGYEGGLPTPTDSKSLSAPQYIKAGQTFDAGWVKYDRGQSCTGQSEGGEADTVFVLEEGATLRNVIIGKNQREGVYCLGACNLEFVWFEDVCEDAISIKGDGTANIIGGGAYKASDKVIQHNGCGHVNIVNFYANDYGKVYRSCGNCKNNCARSVHMEGTTAVNGGELIGINTNLGDKATYSNNCYPKVQCQGYNGCDKANGECEPTKAALC
ncbi:Pectate lyase [Fusarium sp. LHS14.1]|nr:Pectate lyase [Fusarium sp. LHS14.1]